MALLGEKLTDGFADGDTDGLLLDILLAEGASVFAALLGDADGLAEGYCDTDSLLLGEIDGPAEGSLLGETDGLLLGLVDGETEGSLLGDTDGLLLCSSDGLLLG